jgi:hypothetical protein
MFLPLKNFWNTDREKRDYRNLHVLRLTVKIKIKLHI